MKIKATLLATVLVVTSIAQFRSVHALPLSCTQSTPCTLAELLVPGNYFEITHLVASPTMGTRYETMRLSNFDAPVGDFGGGSILVWGAATGLDWQLVMEPNQSAPNPWQIQSSGPDASYLSLLTYDLEFDGLRLDFRGNFRRSNLASGELIATFGQFRNTGGSSIQGIVGETITDNRNPSSSQFSVALDVTCQELERDVFTGCAQQAGSEAAQFDPYDPFDEVDRFKVENSIFLEYVAFTSGGGALEVTRIVNRFTEPAIVAEPSALALVAVGLVALGFGGRKGVRKRRLA
jgi:hypothetical protein